MSLSPTCRSSQRCTIVPEKNDYPLLANLSGGGGGGCGGGVVVFCLPVLGWFNFSGKAVMYIN